MPALSEYLNPEEALRTLTSPAWLGTMATLGVGTWAADRYAAGKWRPLRFIFMGALGAGVGYGILAPMFLPLSRGVLGAAAASSAATAPAPAPSRATMNKTFEPAHGVESAGVVVGQ